MHIKALTFDTGGTILDWHAGLFGAFERVGQRCGLSVDWHEVVNDWRRRAMKAIVGQLQPEFNMDDGRGEMPPPTYSEAGISFWP